MYFLFAISSELKKSSKTNDFKPPGFEFSYCFAIAKYMATLINFNFASLKW